MLIDDLELLKKLVKTGKTIAFLPQNVAREELTSGEFVQFTAKTKAVKRPIYALSLAKSDKPLFLKNFKETLKRINQKNTVDWKPRRIISITDE